MKRDLQKTATRIDQTAITHIVNRLAVTLALLVSIALPASFGLVAYYNLSDSLDFKAKVKAAEFSGLIASMPNLWMYAENQMNGLIAREPVLREDERIEVRDAQGTLVAQSAKSAQTTSAHIIRGSPLFDSGRIVGRVDVIAPLWPVAWTTSVAGICGLLLGVLVYLLMQIFPLRALRHAADALLDEKRQGELLLDELRASEENLAITLNSIGDAVIVTDATGLVTRMNPTAERLTGWTLNDARGLPLSEVFVIVNAQTRLTVANPVQLVMERGQVVELANHTVLLARDGAEYHIADSAAPIRNAAGQIIGVILVISDVSEQYRTAASLHETRAILAAAMDQTPVGIAIADAPDGTIRYINNAGLALRGITPGDFVSGQRIDECYAEFLFFDTDERALTPHDLPLSRAVRFGETCEREFTVRHSDGAEYTYASRAAPILDAQGCLVAAVAIFLDISEKKMVEEEIRRLAFYDQLTGLPNRRLLLDRLKQVLAARSRHLRGGALLFVDLDDFKTINDTLGHDAGDKQLKQIAECLSANVRAGDTVARLGGDEFVVLLDDLSAVPEEAAAQAENIGEKLLAKLNSNYQFGNQALRSSASIGVALFERDVGVDELFKRADLAMYQAKNTGRNTLCFFDPIMQTIVRARVALEAELREAIENEQFLLFYQPQVDATGTVFGAEALLRWQRGDGTLRQPGDFIALAEETGLILTIGEWVISTACCQLAAWAQRPQTEVLSLAVNVSARQFRHPDFVAQVKSALARSGANPRRLKLELTESQLIDDIDSVIAKMSVLRAAGVCFSLDDFGTGYSSLAYLKTLPLNQLKIDRSFVCDLLTDANDAAIVRAIVALGASLGLSVIAEGVENEEQKTRLSELGCFHYQGYHFGRPFQLDDFERIVMPFPIP